MDVSLLRFVLICLMVIVGLGAVFVVALPIVMLLSMVSVTPEQDPTPWCSGCGAMRKADCHCGPIADNE